jgi:hypothetical protein
MFGRILKMIEQPVVHVGDNSPEHVAYQLMRDILIVEGNVFSAGHQNSVDRKQILDTYAECLLAVKSPSARKAA